MADSIQPIISIKIALWHVFSQTRDATDDHRDDDDGHLMMPCIACLSTRFYILYIDMHSAVIFSLIRLQSRWNIINAVQTIDWALPSRYLFSILNKLELNFRWSIMIFWWCENAKNARWARCTLHTQIYELLLAKAWAHWTLFNRFDNYFIEYTLLTLNLRIHTTAACTFPLRLPLHSHNMAIPDPHWKRYDLFVCGKLIELIGLFFSICTEPF